MHFSCVVPSFNQAAFLDRTLESLLSQEGDRVDRLDIVVRDGGSTDGSVEILKRYGDRLLWTSGPDGGQTAAINAGLAGAGGDVLFYLNSDDVLYPGALAAVAAAFAAQPQARVLYGEADHIDADDRLLGRYPTEPWNYGRLLEGCFLCQPAVFWRRQVRDEYGPFDASLRYGMDYDYWLRLGVRESFLHLPVTLAASRCHAQAKRFGQEQAMREEVLEIVCRHGGGRAPLPWIAGAARARAARHLAGRPGSPLAQIAFSLSYWRELGRLAPRLQRKWRADLPGKLLPPLRSALRRERAPFAELA